MSVHVCLRAVDAVFGARIALKGITLNVRRGAVLSIIGESGSGKSTALRLIAGLERPNAGEISFDDEIVASRTVFVPPELRRIGFVFQDFALFPHMRAIDNVAFGLDRMSPSQRRESAHNWLDKVGLGARARAYPHELSGGEQQRVALARALARRPGLVLLDEPFSGLDPSLRTDLRDVALSAIREVGASAVFVTHDIEEALYVGDDLAILKAGRLLQSGRSADVYDAPVCLDAAAALGLINSWRGQSAGGAMHTPFGAIATRIKDGPATLVIRAEALRVREGTTATIMTRQRLGALDLLRVDYSGVTWKALAARNDTLAPGARCALEIDPHGVFTYEADLVSG